MKDFQVTRHNLNDFYQTFEEELAANQIMIVTAQSANTGKWGMARLWRKWMATTAKYMADNGVTMPLMFDIDGKPYGSRPFNPEDAHELFTRQHLGVNANGERLSWGRDNPENGDRKATKGERFHALRKHEMWASEKGITLFVPRNSEYIDLQEQEVQ
ncbi:hypothetical protein [uncultured Psychrosphaera sp.]|uniref:hypothetical protein n=1 Tax=uncultured Psychrosphaera sp. TaxID=1403522 RepID=UPI002626225B|nr:hypothetical protein [uncultured Psychrosphaera sp.]